VIELDPTNTKAYINRGVSKHKLNDYQGAIADFSKVIELDPTNTKAYINRGVSKYKLGDKYGACLDFSKSGELGNGGAYDIIKKFCN
jgi:lipoprotein NlpI